MSISPHLDPHLWRRLKPLFDMACDLPPSEQQAFLRNYCSSDPILWERLEALLNAHRRAGAILDRNLPERMESLSMPSRDDRAESAEPLLMARLKDRYVIEKELGRGGLSVVFLARDETIHNRRVVVKVILRRETGITIENEVQILARLRHRGIAAPLDTGLTPEGSPFLVMDFVPGPTLREVLQSGPISPERVDRLVAVIASALSAAHSVGIWHLDLKPENVIVRDPGTESEMPVLVDFGISRMSDCVHPSGPGGSLSYTAPEQISGEPCAASDQFSLAVMVREMLTGVRPKPLQFSGVKAPSCSRRVNAVLNIGLRPIAAQRYIDVKTFASTLSAALDPDSKRRRWTQVAAWAAVSAAVVIACIALRTSALRQREQFDQEINVLQEYVAQTAAIVARVHGENAAYMQALQRSLDRLERLYSDGHREFRFLEIYQQALFQTGILHGHPGIRHLGHSEQGVNALTASVKIADEMMVIDSQSNRTIMLATEARDALAGILIETGQYSEAMTTLREATDILRHAQPDSRYGKRIEHRKAAIGLTASRVYLHTRELDRCLLERDQALAIFRGIARSAGAGSRDDQVSLAGALSSRAYVYAEMGRVGEALKDYRESSQILQELLDRDSWNSQTSWMRARNDLESGRILLSAGERREAYSTLSKAAAKMRSLIGQNYSEVPSLRSLALCLSWQSVAAARGAGTEFSKEALRLSELARSLDPVNAKAQEEAVLIRNNATAAGLHLP